MQSVSMVDGDISMANSILQRKCRFPNTMYHSTPFLDLSGMVYTWQNLTDSTAQAYREPLLTPELVERSASRPHPLYPKENKPRYQMNRKIFNGLLQVEVSSKRFATAKHAECQAANKARVKPSSRPASSMTTVVSAFVGRFLLWPIWWSLAVLTSGLWSGGTNLELKLQPSGTSWLIQADCFPPLVLLPRPTTPFVVVPMLCSTAVCCHLSKIRL